MAEDQPENKCSKCHKNEAEALHSCQYKQEINDDHSFCDCCEECEQDCVDSI